MLSLDAIAENLERALQASPADETEVVWLEVRRGTAQNQRRRIESRIHHERTILIRVIDRGRVGSHRTGGFEGGELDAGIRQAIAQSRSRDPLPGLPHIPADNSPLVIQGTLWDPAIEHLDNEGAERLFGSWLPRQGTCTMRWSAARVAVFNSRGVRRNVEVTAAGIDSRIGRRPGGGRASGAARTLDALSPQAVLERAQNRHASGNIGELPSDPVTIVLAPEAAAQMCEVLNRVAFSAIAYSQGSSFLRQHLGVQVFDRSLNLRDDGTDPRGIPFPFDLEGSAKSAVDLILKGTPKTPALDQRQAAQMGLTPTAHAIGGNDARALNIFLMPGDFAEGDLLASAEDGVWIGSLDHIECFEPGRVQLRSLAQGVRRIRERTLGEGLPDLIWEDSMLRALSNLVGIGSDPIVRLGSDGYSGGVSAPALAISGCSGLRPATS